MVEDFESGKLTRRQLVTHLTAAAAAMAAIPELATAQQEESTFQATSVDHVALQVTDVQRSRTFYERHLGLEVWRDSDESSCFLNAGKDFLALFRGDVGQLDHYAFSIEGYTAGGAVEKLEAAGLEAKRRGNRVYFDDPDGIEVQVTAAR
jgi:catechol 2,3-dioxygenase-like lactoylglutathione lyase family enzyme